MRAHAPGSVTGLFAPAPDDGSVPSRGASFAIEDGVVVDVRPATETTITVEGETASFEPVERVLALLGVTASVDVQPEVPLGHGFGASGAATLATALAADAALDLGESRESLLESAHRAELASNTGQGDVFVQERGGLIWSADGQANRLEPADPVEYATAGSISTAEMLADERFMATARRSGQAHLARFDSSPSLRELAERSRVYVGETAIATPFVEREIERVEAAGGVAGMALFGETVFAVGVDGVLANRTRIPTRGVRVLADEA